MSAHTCVQRAVCFGRWTSCLYTCFVVSWTALLADIDMRVDMRVDMPIGLVPSESSRRDGSAPAGVHPCTRHPGQLHLSNRKAFSFHQAQSYLRRWTSHPSSVCSGGSTHTAIHMSMHTSTHMSTHMSAHMSAHMSMHRCDCRSGTGLHVCPHACAHVCLHTRAYRHAHAYQGSSDVRGDGC